MILGLILKICHTFLEIGLPALVFVLLPYKSVFGEFLNGCAVSSESLVAVACTKPGLTNLENAITVGERIQICQRLGAVG